MVKKEQKFKNWIIQIQDRGSITVSKDGKVCDNVKSALKTIADENNWSVKAEWTTQELGRFVVDVLEMMGKKTVKFDGRTTVDNLKRYFKCVYNVSLRVYDGKNLADDSKRLSELRTDGAKSTGALECRASITVGSLIERVKEQFGLDIKIATQDDWVLVLDGITLANAGKIKKQATKADMEGMEGYQRDEKEVEKENTSGESSEEPFELLIDTYDITYKFRYDDTELYVKVGENYEILTSEKKEYYDEEMFEDTGKVVNEQCHDFDELAVVIAKNIIKSSSKIYYTVYDCGEPEFVCCVMTSDYKLVTDDFTQTVTIKPAGGQPCQELTVVELEEDEVDEVREMITNKDVDALHNYLYDNDELDVFEVFNLWGDEDREVLGFEVVDSYDGELLCDGEAMHEGLIPVKEENVFDYDNYNRFAGEHAPKYLLVHPDEIKKSWASFNLPVDADIKNVHFHKLAIFTFDHPTIGDTITTIGALHYAGQELDCIDEGNNGTYGSNSFILLRKQKRDNNWYDIMAEC
ncbi:MAG: hypothetical protein MJY52_01940 [Bacteroidaceae bacterium]|nr:hypothetical protein [Bacteroidaceae bacterium]